jgi:hypothetical protein
MCEELWQALGRDFDFVAVTGSTVAKSEANFGGG